MLSRKWTPALVSILSLTLASMACAEPRIGTTASTRPNADGIIGANTRTLAAGSEIYANETVRTGNLGMADLVFLDSTNLSVGPTSEVRLDKFVYDPSGSSGSVVMNATRGAFRFVTGSQAKHVYRVNTPYGTLGVRGTVVEIVLKPDIVRKMMPDECVAKIRLVEGAASYRTRTGKIAELTQPGQVACITPRGDVVYSISSESILSFDVAVAPPPAPIIPGPGVTPPLPCISPTTLNCQ
jgi:hypothetical protein